MPNPPYSIIYQDEWILAAAKAPGLPSQPDQSGDPPLSDLVQAAIGSRLFTVHRIDRPASGLVLFARSQDIAARLSDLFRRQEVERRYWAIVASAPEPPAATLEHRIVHDRRTNKSRVVSDGGQTAQLSYEVVRKSERYWLLDVKLRTGRHHQIRAQLARIGCPIRGDLKYGAPRSLPGGGICLHARELRLPHPHTGTATTISAPPPEDTLWRVLTAGR